jgi:prolyl-tRNA synthetase
MRFTQLFAPTLRDAPREAELVSHKLLLRGGFIRPLASGVYSYLPLGLRVLNKISGILREEMNRAGGAEMLMPSLVPRGLLEESGRDKIDVLFTAQPHDYFLGFTHEEVVTDIVRGDVQSYKQLPLLPYQIQTKFRNEPRPRGGLIRCREFLMLDAYSFDKDEAGGQKSYSAVRAAFARMFARCGLESLAVEADSGAIGGSQSEEFMVLSEDGEDTVLRCDRTGYAANAERCEAVPVLAEDPDTSVVEAETFETPGRASIGDVVDFLGIPATRLIKTLVFAGPDGQPVVALVRGDRDLNEAKLAKLLGGPAVLADAATVERVTGAPVGFAGPVGLRVPVRVVADREVGTVRDGVVGANAPDAHLVHVLPGRDFPHPEYHDLRTAVAGDVSPADPEGRLVTQRGIEVGHVFNFGTRYSQAMGATFSDEGGKSQLMQGGSYGVGVSRLMAAAVEQGHDAGGILWPVTIAPFEAVVVLVGIKDDAQKQAAESLYQGLLGSGVDVLLDDRDDRPGSKFKDADLLGIPVQVVVGKSLAEGTVEVSLRRDKAGKEAVPVADAAAHVRRLVDGLKAEIAVPAA